MRYRTQIAVRYAETDRMGIVYHANYLVWFEIARSEFLEKLGFPYEEMEKAGYMSPVADVQLSYGMPLTYGVRGVQGRPGCRCGQAVLHRLVHALPRKRRKLQAGESETHHAGVVRRVSGSLGGRRIISLATNGTLSAAHCG